jgi:hypothetical protein
MHFFSNNSNKSIGKPRNVLERCLCRFKVDILYFSFVNAAL